MEATGDKRIFVLATPLGELEPVLPAFRATGFEIRWVPDGQPIPRSHAEGLFDFVLCSAETFLAKENAWSRDAAHLRAAMAAIIESLRNVLNSLIESINGPLQAKPEAPTVYYGERLAAVRRDVARIQEFLTDLQAEVSNGCKEEFRTVALNLEDVVEEAALTVYAEASRKEQRLLVNIDEEAAEVWADRPKLRRILIDLLTNAVGQSPTAGSVTVGARREGSDCVITVSDSGEGSPPEEIARLFSPTENTGAGPPTGPGLATVKKAAEQHGGRVWAESRRGRGTTIFVLLPQPPGGAVHRTAELHPAPLE